MAKKVAAFDEESVEENGGIKAKKKRNKCLTCCLIALIVSLVLFLIAFIVGWILGDKFTQQAFGLSMGDTLGVLNDMYWTDDEDVVTRPFSKKDINGFYDQIKRNILLKDEAEVDFGGALDKAIDKYLGIGESAAKLNASADGQGDGEGDDGIINIFVDMIAEVMNRDNIDIERLNKYDAAKPETDEYLFKLNDKQLASFINAILTKVLKNAGKVDGLKDINDMVKLSKVVALKQIKFTAKSQKTDAGETEIKAASALITVWVGLQDAASMALDKLLTDAGMGWVSGIAGFFGDVILPENLYLTISVPLHGEDNKAYVVINDMNAKERARANKLINGLLKMMNGDDSLTLDETVDSFVSEIKPILEDITGEMDFSDAGKGNISFDLLDSVAKMASEESGEPLTKADFLYVLQALFSDRTEQMNSLIPYRFENWYNVDGKLKYLPNGHPTAKKVDYEQEFVDAISDAYAINFGEGSGLSGVLEMLGISLDGDEGDDNSKDLLNSMDSDGFNSKLDKDINDIKLNITDRMMGAAFSKQMGELNLGTASNIDMNLIAISFVEKPGRKGHTFALLAVDVDLDGMLKSMNSGDSFITKFASGLMPKSILLTVTVDITLGMPEAQRDKAEFIINSCGAAKTETVLATLEKFAPDLDFNEIATGIGNSLNTMFTQLNDEFSIELVSSEYELVGSDWVGKSGAMVMPDIFTVITNKALVTKNPDGTVNKLLTPDELKSVVRELNNPPTIKADPAKDDCSEFIADVFSKYYLGNDITDQAKMPKTFDNLTEYLTDFNTKKLVTSGRYGIAHDTRLTDELKPVMSNLELYSLLQEKMNDDTADSHEILSLQAHADRLEMMLAISLADALKDATAVDKIISADYMYMSATFHTDEVINTGTADNPQYGYRVETVVKSKDGDGYKDMDEGTYNAMLRLIKFYAPGFSVEDQAKEFGVMMYKEMHSLNTSLGGDDQNEVFSFIDGGLQLTDFYTFLKLKMLKDTNYQSEDIRATVQGLYEYDDRFENPNNYKEAEIIFNPPYNDKFGGLKLDTAYTDKVFNAFIKQGVEGIGGKGEVTVEQTMILTSGDTRGNPNKMRNMLNTKLALTGTNDEITAQYSYLVITFSMAMTSFAGGETDGAGLFPSKIYSTVVYKFTGSSFTVVGGISSKNAPVVVFNKMTALQYEIMMKLMDANPEDTGENDPNKVNIKSVARRGEQVLNGLLNPTIGGATIKTSLSFGQTDNDKDGLGTITLSAKV